MSYAGSALGVTIVLLPIPDINTGEPGPGTGWGGDAQSNTLTGIEAVIGSAFDDALTGDEAGNLIDFEAGLDQIRLGADPFDVLAGAAQSGPDVVIDLGFGNSLTLADTLLSELSASDFVFFPPVEPPEPPMLA